MDQKHAMMYPSLAGRPDNQQSTSFQDNRASFEAPPSYDFAMSSPMPQPSAPAPPVSMPNTRAYLPPPPPPSAQPIHQHLAAESFTNSVAVRAPLPPVIVEQPVREPLKLGPQPSTVTCPECGERRKTRMHHTPNRRTHIFAVVLCLVGWCCCACCVPYCMNSCKTGHHYCPKCNRFLGTHKPNEP